MGYDFEECVVCYAERGKNNDVKTRSMVCDGCLDQLSNYQNRIENAVKDRYGTTCCECGNHKDSDYGFCKKCGIRCKIYRIAICKEHLKEYEMKPINKSDISDSSDSSESDESDASSGDELNEPDLEAAQKKIADSQDLINKKIAEIHALIPKSKSQDNI